MSHHTFIQHFLHDVYSHPLCGHTLHIVDQPMNDFGTYEAVEWEAFLFWEQLDTGRGMFDGLQDLYQRR